ncbi:NADH-ubiquinone oxidoreductase-like protein 21 kDa subunit [Saccharata proteae CBS 121410]|uniref:NADH-ubiquinone oxidoreductase-like protein 21 kDa subunit n=1 Tax=Saccharata proteae CBS 121410 TaxID=1314787 RepID=A0A9P4LXH3_9PEZI|nr:NADH-ubiquinone oxidoreductase-like protein 21 kDa subunit [Saccharata proteae CBS 121410]
MSNDVYAPTRQRVPVPSKQPYSDYPLIDNDPHFKRVVKYARLSDWLEGAALAIAGPTILLWQEAVSPSFVGKAAYGPIMRVCVAGSIGGGFLYAFNKSQYRLYGARENRREIEMDMREMVDKVKQGKPLYGETSMPEHMQGIASRNSRYAGTFLHLIPWFNFVNHNQHGVDTAKYYRQAELELEAERKAFNTGK